MFADIIQSAGSLERNLFCDFGILDKYQNDVFANGDISIYATMTVLLAERRPSFKIGARTISVEELNEAIQQTNPDHYNFLFVTDANQTIMTAYETDTFPTIDRFLSEKNGRTLNIYRLKNTNTMVTLVPILTAPELHGFQVFIPQYFPELFEEKPLTDAERDMLLALGKTICEPYLRKVQDLFENEPIRRIFLSKTVRDYEGKFIRKRISDAEQMIGQLRMEMDDLLHSYRVKNQKMESLIYISAGLEARLKDGTDTSDTEDYLCENKNLCNIVISSGRMQFIVKTFLLPYLLDDWDSLSARGYIFRDYPEVYNPLDDPENLKLLLDAIFSRDHCLKLKLCGKFSLALNGGYASVEKGYDYGKSHSSLKDYIPNPHFHFHHCLGRNQEDILYHLKNSDMISAIEGCINATQRINVSENPTFRPFVENFRKSSARCLITPDGAELTPCEALAYLKARNQDGI